MPRQPEPWFRDGRGWYVQIDRKQTFLGEHPRNAPLPKKNPSGRWNVPPIIWDEFHRRMGERTTTGSTKIPRVGSAVVLIFDAFLDWLQHRVVEGTKARRTYEWYRKYLQSFATFVTCDYCIAELTVGQLEPIHVYLWVDSHAGWRTGKRGAMTAVQRALNWAAKAGLLKSLGGKSPLAALEKPAPGRREQLVSEGEYQEVLSLLTSTEARDLIELAWETGMRPHELFTAEARFFDQENARIVFPVKLSKGKKLQRVVYLSNRALEVVRRNAALHPDGPVLRNTVPLTEIDVTFSQKSSRGNASSLGAGVPAESEASCPTNNPSPTPWRFRRTKAPNRPQAARFRAGSTSIGRPLHPTTPGYSPLRAA